MLNRVFHTRLRQADRRHLVHDVIGGGYLGSFPFYSGDYPYYDGGYPPAPLYAPYGFYGCRAGCCRRAVWRGRHWHNVTTCH